MAKRGKWILYGLVSINVMVILAVIWLVFIYPSDGGRAPLASLDTQGMAKFEVRSDKADLEKVINGYLQDNVISDKLSYQIELNDDLRFLGEVRILGRTVPVEIGFQPVVQENGDLLLKQDYFKVGSLRLPRSLVLEYVRSSYAFPEWIDIQPSRRQILLASTAMNTKSGLIIRVREFDLTADELRYEVWIP